MRWVVSNFLVINILIFCFQKAFKGREKQQGFSQWFCEEKEKQPPAAQNNAQQSRTAQHHKATQHHRTQHREQDPQQSTPKHQATGWPASGQTRTPAPTHANGRQNQATRPTNKNGQQQQAPTISQTAAEHGTTEAQNTTQRRTAQRTTGGTKEQHSSTPTDTAP